MPLETSTISVPRVGQPGSRFASWGMRLPVLVAFAFVVSQPASAHLQGGPVGGFQSGFVHPILGLDHLLAMLAVGIWGAQMGGRSVWTLPVTFPLVMALGSVLGMSGIVLPQIELGIALSVLLLGLAIAFAWKAPGWVALLLISVFAVCHGYAHGVEIPGAVSPVAYANGFVVATGLIHIAGIVVGLMLGRLWNGQLSQALGASIALTGLYITVGAFSA